MSAAGFYHCSVKSVGRANGRSVVAAAAYRAGERLTDELTGQVQDYQLRHGVLDTFILAPANAPSWAHDRERLWNAAERAEPRANGRLATEIELALPHELTDAQRKALLTDYLRPLIERHGVAADVAIHAPGQGSDHRNIHAHVLITHRELEPDGFGEVSNARTVTKKVKGQFKEVTLYGIAANPADVLALRKEWETQVNRAYERAGLDLRVDHRSHADRGIEQEPTKHLGPTATQMEKRGVASERGDLNRDIAQRNVDRRMLKALHAEAQQIAAAIIELESGRTPADQRQTASSRYDEVRASRQDAIEADRRANSEPAKVFTSAANHAAEPAAPVYDRDADNAAWEAKLAEAAIAAQEARQPSERGIPTYRAASENAPETATTRPIVASGPETAKTPDLRPLGKTAGEIRLAWSLSRSAEELDEALAARGITLAAVTAEEARQSEHTAAFAKAVGNFARVLREGEIVAVDGRGGVHRLDARTTGEPRPDIEARFPQLDRAGLLTVTAAREAMQEASRLAWQAERQAEREKARPASAIEGRIIECAEQARINGAIIERDENGRRVFGAEALAIRLDPAGIRMTETVTGPEAFAARLQEAGIAVVRVTAADVLALDALRREEDLARLAGATNGEARRSHHFAEVHPGELAAVTRGGDVHRINPDKLGGAARQLAADLPSVVEARAGFEIDREQTAEIWAQRRADAAATREAYAAEAEQRADAAHATREARQAAHDIEGAGSRGFRVARRAVEGVMKAVETTFGLAFGWAMAGPKLTPQQRHDQARAETNEETLHARAYAAAQQEKEADQDGRMFEQNRSREIARTLNIEVPGDPEEDRFRSIMQRAARDRERDRDYEHER